MINGYEMAIDLEHQKQYECCAFLPAIRGYTTKGGSKLIKKPQNSRISLKYKELYWNFIEIKGKKKKMFIAFGRLFPNYDVVWE